MLYVIDIDSVSPLEILNKYWKELNKRGGKQPTEIALRKFIFQFFVVIIISLSSHIC